METPNAQNRVLVAHASRLGSTAEVATFIGETLAERGDSVDILTFADVDNVRQYDRIIIGSAIRYDRWLPEATAFVESYRDELSQVPIDMFFTCLTLAGGSPKGKRKATTYAEKIRQLLPASADVRVRGFAGVLDPTRGPLGVRLLLRALSRVSGIAPGDYRDWDAIGTWAADLSPITSDA